MPFQQEGEKDRSGLRRGGDAQLEQVKNLKPKSQNVNNKRVALTHPMTHLSCDEDYIKVTQTHWCVSVKTLAARRAGTVTNY